MPFNPLSNQSTSGFKPISQFPTQQPQEQQKSFFQRLNNLVQNTLPNAIGGAGKAIIGDAAKLGATAVSRATELATRQLAPNSDAAKGYEALAAEGQPVNIGGIQVDQPTKKNIVGDALKTAAYLFPYGKVAGAVGSVTGKTVGNVVSGAAGGYLADAGMGLSNEQPVGEALTPGLGTALGAAIPAAGAVTRGVGRLTAKVGEKIVDVGVPMSSREAQILQAYKAEKPFFTRVAEVLKGTEKAPQTAAKTATTTKAGQSISGLFGTKSNIGVQAKRASKSLWEDLIQPRLKASEQAVDMDGFFTKAQQDIIEQNPDLSRQKALLEALDAIKEDYAGIKAVGLEQLQKYKEGWAKFVPESSYKGKPIGGAKNEVRSQLANEARQTIYNQLGDDVKQAYFDYGNLLGLQEMGQVAMTGQKLKGGAGSFISELTSQVVTPVATVGGQVVYRLGKGIEFIGQAGAKTLGQALRFPGDSLVDSAAKRFDDNFKLVQQTGSQSGFLNLGQDLMAPTKTQSSQRATKAAKKVISSSIPPQTDTGNSFYNRLNKYEEEALAKARKTVATADPLIAEAKKYKSAEEFVKAQNTTKTIGDTVPDYFKNEELIRRNTSGTPISEIDTSKIIDEGYKNLSSKERDILKNALNDRTKKTITVYRSGNGEIKNGDFVALDKTHAEQYLSRGSGRKLFKAEIPKNNLVYNDRAGDFMYKLDESQLTDIWKKANKKK